MADKFYIGPYDQGSGQVNNLKPFYIVDQAFERLENVYAWRGRIKKRPGSRLIGNTMQSSRLRVAVGTYGSPDAAVPAAAGAVGQMFSIAGNAGQEDVLFTVKALGTPFDFDAQDAIAYGSATAATFNTTNGTFTFTTVLDASAMEVPAGSTIYWYPALPVMGLVGQEVSSVNSEPTVAFDTKYSYSYNTTTNGWERITTGGAAALWEGSNSQYFQQSNWYVGTDTALFVTNGNALETSNMRYLVGTTWTAFKPEYTTVGGTTYILSAKFLVLFKNRLIALAPTIGASAPGTFFGNRVAIPQPGNPAAASAYDTTIPGKGTSIDAATNEQIIGYSFVKDRLIVSFERSTFELAYTGNEFYPFTWNKLNTELGAESPNSLVTFDKFSIGIGNVGIHACNGSNVERIDEAIPNFVFSIHNANDGVKRVYGIRDFQNETVYWSYPSDRGSDSSEQPFCNKVLLYNYNNGTWAFLDDSIMCFGYFQVAPENGITWDSETVTWDDDLVWGGGSTVGLTKEVIAGNQQGYTFIFDYQMNRNAPALSIADIAYGGGIVTVTAIDHNFSVDQWIMFDGITVANLNYLNKKNYQITSITDKDTFVIALAPIFLSGVYEGGGTIERIENHLIQTKQFNLYAQQAKNAAIDQIDILMDKTAKGQTTLSFATSTSPVFNNNVGNDPITIETFPYPTYYPYETEAAQVWRTAYIDASGSYIQLKFTMTDIQMGLTEVGDEGDVSGPTLDDFELHSIVLTSNPSGRMQ